MIVVAFTVIGEPAPQGSKTKTRYGMREDNPNTKPWRATVKADAYVAMRGRPAVNVPVRVTARFFFPRPQSHYRSGRFADELKANAPIVKDGAPDNDKLCRAVGDSLKGVVLRDDARIAQWVASKWFGYPPRCELVVEELDPLTGLLAGS